MPKEKSAGAVIFRKQEDNVYYLLLHYRSKHWDFPKGHIEENETDQDTVKREVEEETGIKDIKIIPGFKNLIKYFFKHSYGLPKEKAKKIPWTFKTVVFYLAETETKEVKISEEHIGFKWLCYKDAYNQLTHKNAKNILDKADEFLKQGFT